MKQGANVIYEKTSGIHVSGHASQEELKLIHNLVRPKFFIPVHGEYRHLRKHAMLAQDLGMPKENVFVAENGNIIEFTKEKGGIVGKVPSGIVLVDGLGVGDVGNIVLRDRRQLSQDGILIIVVTMDKEMGAVVAGPDIVSRGFVYVRESEDLMGHAREVVEQALDSCMDKIGAENRRMKPARSLGSQAASAIVARTAPIRAMGRRMSKAPRIVVMTVMA